MESEIPTPDELALKSVQDDEAKPNNWLSPDTARRMLEELIPEYAPIAEDTPHDKIMAVLRSVWAGEY